MKKDMENIKNLICGMQLNGFNDELIEKVLKLKATAAELGWEMDGYDEMFGNVYITFMTVKEDKGPEYDSAGYTEADRIIDGSYRVKSNITPDDINTHHCDDPSCNCSI
jgi:hypothetical protein